MKKNWCGLLVFSLVVLSSVNAAVLNKGVTLTISDGVYFCVGGAGSLGSFHNKSEGLTEGKVNLRGTMTVEGDVINAAHAGNTFSDVSTGAVILDGSSQNIEGLHRFPNLKKEVASTDTLTFQEGSSARTTIGGTLTLKGAAGQLLSLRGNAGVTQWEIDPQGGRVLEYLDVKDSKNVNGIVIDVVSANCTDSGNNTNWLFEDVPTFTVTFTAGPKGAVVGNLTQQVPSGGKCQSVEAVPDAGWHFTNWTLAGAEYSKSNPLTVTNVTADMALTANFEENPAGTHDVRFFTDGNGTIAGDAVQFVATGADCTPVTAVPNAGYRFDSWSGGHTGTENPLTVLNVNSDLAITANFVPLAPGFFAVTFVSGGNGAILGDVVQVVAAGADCTEVIAIPDSGYYFETWTGDYVGTDNPLTVTKVSSNMIIEAKFAEIKNAMTLGKILVLAPGEIAGYTLQEFRSKPAVSALYADPVKIKQMKAKFKNMNRMSAKSPAPLAHLAWTKKFAFVDKNEWLKTETCEQTLSRLFPDSAGRPPYLNCSLNTTIAYVDDLGQKIKLKDSMSGDAYVVTPVILRVLNESSAVTTVAGPGETLTVVGRFYGTKPPKIWMEYSYPKGNGQVKQWRLKVEKPYAYSDYKNVIGKSCMDIFSGESSVTVAMPDEWPSYWDHSESHNIVIDNGMCRTTISFSTKP